jgi:hypothetical protein
MSSETGRILPKKGPKTGRTFPNDAKVRQSPYVEAISAALREELGDTRHGTKIAMRWTGAGDRTVRNWFDGISGPSGEHLVALAGHSDRMFKTFLVLAGRGAPITTASLVEVRGKLAEALEDVDQKISTAMTNQERDDRDIEPD